MHNARHDSPRIHRNLRPIAARLIPLIKILTGEQWTAFKNKTTSGSRAFIRGHRVETTGRRTPPTISFAKTFLVISSPSRASFLHRLSPVGSNPRSSWFSLSWTRAFYLIFEISLEGIIFDIVWFHPLILTSCFNILYQCSRIFFFFLRNEIMKLKIQVLEVRKKLCIAFIELNVNCFTLAYFLSWRR